jgi:membrane protein required for colicin V production
MNALDWTIVALLAISVLLGVWRGFVREVLSLAGWVVGLWLALRYASTLGESLPFELEWPGARTAIAALVIVLGCVVAAALAAWLIGKFMNAVKLTGTDRLLGALFGLARALIVLWLLVLVASRTALAQQPLWRDSVLVPHAEAAVRFAAPWLPSSLSASGTRT